MEKFGEESTFACGYESCPRMKELEAKIAEREEMLRKLEWNLFGYCDLCGGNKDFAVEIRNLKKGHSDDCEFKKLVILFDP
jgi:hypothetical protein